MWGGPMATKRIKRAKKSAARARRVTPEGALKRLVLDYLAARRIRVKRNQVGVMNVGGRRIPFGEKGEADLTAFVPCWRDDGFALEANRPRFWRHLFFVLNLELKAPNGRQSFEQKLWQQAVEASGEYYLLVNNLDQVIEWLEAHK